MVHNGAPKPQVSPKCGIEMIAQITLPLYQLHPITLAPTKRAVQSLFLALCSRAAGTQAALLESASKESRIAKTAARKKGESRCSMPGATCQRRRAGRPSLFGGTVGKACEVATSREVIERFLRPLQL